MNLTNVQKAIDVMERVKARGDHVNMSDWQVGTDYGSDEEHLHNCGTAACFAGWIAVSNEWQADGGYVTLHGCPRRNKDAGVLALTEWLGIPAAACGALCTSLNGEVFLDADVYGGKDLDEIDADDVLAALYRLRDTGTVYLTGGWDA